ncbi:caffeoyl-CoA O-methyltransferase [Pseudohyphozyma bogoriensis]|nr:caffeoyl-CoA O-methyltransferase [Pseudohyphozyma bogoriensis]
MSSALAKAPTPHSRIVRLLAAALPHLDKSHPAFEYIEEAYDAAAGLDPYLESYTSELIVPSTHKVGVEEVRKVFKALVDRTFATDWSALYKEGKTKWELHGGMCSGAYEATFLQHVALDTKAKNILEIGLFTGTTTLALGLLPDVQSITACDIEPYLEEYDRPAWVDAGVSDKIKTVFGPAADSIKKFKEEGRTPFDMVFIDADKPSYLTYVKLLVDLDMLAPGGIILGDNTLYKGYPYAGSTNPVSPSAHINSNNRSHDEATQGINDFNKGVRDDPRLDVVILPIRDGVSIIRRKI